MPPSQPPGVLAWLSDRTPFSNVYGDIYFDRTDGLGESRKVFLEGCDLPNAWRSRSAFVVGELGFGTGRNVAALLELWGRTRPAGGRLHVFSVEAHPLAAKDAGRALASWPDLAAPAQLILDRWPGVARGFHRVDLPEYAASLDVAIMPAIDALGAWTGRADAWFLDGFAPARNPEMWRADLLRLVAQRSAPCARAASFTVAGSVRRDLAAAGFTVERLSGAGGKRERLAARLPGVLPPLAPAPRVAMIGAGIAGASLARAFGDLGLRPELFDSVGPGAGASGAPAALVAPRLDAGLAAPAALFAQAARRALTLYKRVGGAVLQWGLLQLASGAKDARRFATIARSDLFEPASMTVLDAAAAARRLGEAAAHALAIAGGAAIDPAAVLGAWLPHVSTAHIAAIEPCAGGWRGLSADGLEVFTADIVCLAAGLACADLAPGLPLVPVRGQASLAHGVQTNLGVAFGGYVIAAPGGTVFGATHDRGDTDWEPRDVDEARNLAAVRARLPGFAAALAAAPRRSWAAVRAATADYLPIAGEVAPGLFVLTGLGSRGFTMAPLLGEHVAAAALGAPSPLPARAQALVSPDRFDLRARRRGGSLPARV